MASNQPIKRKRETPAGDYSLSAETKMGQKMALVHQRLSFLGNGGSSSKHVDNDDDFEPTDEKLDIVVGQQSKAVDDCDDPDDKIVRPTSGENGQEKRPGIRIKHGARKPEKAKRKREWPVGPKSSKSKKEEKPTLVDSSRRNKSKKHNANDFELEVPDDDGLKKHARAKDFYGTAWGKAMEVNEKLTEEGPSFVKLILKSRLGKGFWLCLPHSFCSDHLPDNDVTMAIEDEEGRIYDIKYKANWMRLLDGWNRFAVDHDLNVHDAVVFQLVRPTRFKVYILRRENKLTTPDGALSLDSSVGSNNPSEEESSDEDVNSKEDPKDARFTSNPFGDDSNNNLASEEDFHAVKSFRDFNIVLGGLAIPDRVRRTYYQLCSSRKAFLHRHVHTNPGMTAALIVQTVDIAEGIRGASPSLDVLTDWKRTLQFLERMGMDVAFLRKRVDDLHQVAVKEKLAAAKWRYLKSKMSAVNDALTDLGMELDEVEEMVESIVRRWSQLKKDLQK